MKRVLNKRSTFFQRCLASLGIICVISGVISFSFVTMAYASPSKHQDVTPCNNPAQPAPTSSSLLVVLLDRSGSLVADTGATDPDLYSASVTKALADVWRGKMAVVAFHTINPSGHDEQVQLTTIGPLQVGEDKALREELQNQVQLLPRASLGTPTGPAMDQALTIIGTTKAPLSRVVLITDGEPGYHSNDSNANDPDGSKEESYIRSTLLKKYCDTSVPVDTVGLEIGGDANAVSFLSDVAAGTGGQYQSVQDPTDLANAVLGLYGQWQQNHVNFRPLQLQPDRTYHVSISDLARSLDFFVFRSSNTITIRDPNGQPLQAAVENSVDKHYVYETLDLSPPRPDGDYTIDVGGDPQAQVYAFIESRLRVQIVAPDQTTQPAINQPVQIQAKLLDDQKPLQIQGGAAVTAYVTFTIPGQRPITEQVDLQQQNGQGLFIGKTTFTYSQTGQLQVRVVANYAGVRAEEVVTTQVVCGSSVPCLVKQYIVFFLLLLLLLAVLLAILTLFLFWRFQAEPFGILHNAEQSGIGNQRNAWSVSLERKRSLRQRFLHKSVIDSYEIEKCSVSQTNPRGANFGAASFYLSFKGRHKDRQARIYQKPNNLARITVVSPKGEQVSLNQDKPVELENGSKINIQGKDVAEFSA